MRIAIYNDWWSPHLVGGAERTALDLSKELAKSFGSENIQIYTLSNSRKTQKEIIDGLQVTRLSSGTFRTRFSVGLLTKLFEKFRILVDTRTQKIVAAEILKFYPDVVILHNVDRLGLRFSSYFHSISKIPLVRIQHDLGDTCIYRTRVRKTTQQNCINSCRTCKFKENFYRKESENYSLMLSTSKFVEASLRRFRFSPQNSNYGYPKLMTSVFESEHFSFENSSSLKLGFVGRIVPEKGIETVLRSLFILKSHHNKIGSLTICGTGDKKYLKRLRQIATDLSIDLVMLGHSEDPYDSLRGKIDAVVVPSTWQEPLGRVPMEAIGHGFPCFVSEIGGLPESKFFVAGPIEYFEPANADDLAEKIANALDAGIPISSPSVSTNTLSSILEEFCHSIESSQP
jgi:glycosyltransferase involved in cell wall biosynthesis